MLQRFDVAVWRVFDGRDLPMFAEGVEAANAFEALEMVLWELGWQKAAHAHVVALNGSLQYRAYGVCLAAGAVRNRQVEELVHLRVMVAWSAVAPVPGAFDLLGRT